MLTSSSGLVGWRVVVDLLNQPIGIVVDVSCYRPFGSDLSGHIAMRVVAGEVVTFQVPSSSVLPSQSHQEPVGGEGLLVSSVQLTIVAVTRPSES